MHRSKYVHKALLQFCIQHEILTVVALRPLNVERNWLSGIGTLTAGNGVRCVLYRALSLSVAEGCVVPASVLVHTSLLNPFSYSGAALVSAAYCSPSHAFTRVFTSKLHKHHGRIFTFIDDDCVQFSFIPIW